MEIQKIEIDKLNPSKYNPRIDLQANDKDYKKIENSINEFGYIDPIIWNKQTGNVVGGHQRLKILIEKGYKEVEVSIVDLDIIKQKALNIALNKTGGDWDNEKLAILLEELQAQAELEITGFDIEEFEKIINTEINNEEIKEDNFDIESNIPEEPYTQKGDIWLLGKHRLLCGDSTNTHDIVRLLDNNKIDMIFTDPPYNVNYFGRTKDKLTIENDNMEKEDFRNLLNKVFENLFNFAKEGCPIYVCHSDTEGINFRNAFKTAGFKLAEVLIWVKDIHVLGRQDYHWRHEPILYGWKEGKAHYFINDRTQNTIWEIDKPLTNKEHPTMKPVELVARAINNSSKIEDIVADFFGGSGTTLIAAEQLKRIAYLVEIDPKYCDVIVKRYMEFVNSSKGAKLIRNNKEFEYKDICIETNN